MATPLHPPSCATLLAGILTGSNPPGWTWGLRSRRLGSCAPAAPSWPRPCLPPPGRFPRLRLTVWFVTLPRQSIRPTTFTLGALCTGGASEIVQWGWGGHACSEAGSAAPAAATAAASSATPAAAAPAAAPGRASCDCLLSYSSLPASLPPPLSQPQAQRELAAPAPVRLMIYPASWPTSRTCSDVVEWRSRLGLDQEVIGSSPRGGKGAEGASTGLDWPRLASSWPRAPLERCDAERRRSVLLAAPWHEPSGRC